MREFFDKLKSRVLVWWYEQRLQRLYDLRDEIFYLNLTEARDSQMLPRESRELVTRFNKLLAKRNRYAPPSEWQKMR